MLICIQVGVSCRWINDSHHFILENFDAICNSPSEIYCYALPLSPSTSWLHKYYSSELSQEVKVVKGLRAEWETHSRTVSSKHIPLALACWNDVTVVGLESGAIIVLDPITGSHTCVFSGHTDWVRSLALSLDGVSLVSGGDDRMIKLWDMQTGDPFKTFIGHTSSILSVSISADSTIIASGSRDCTICLWDAQTGGCCHVIRQHEDPVTCVNFSPTNPQHFISASQDGIIQQWDIIGNQIGPAYDGTYVTFSTNGAHFVSHKGRVAKVQNSDSGVVIAELHVVADSFWCCCFSPSGLVAGAAGHNVYVWDITGPDPNLIETHIGHTSFITSLAYSSYLVSASDDKTIKFWQTSASSPANLTMSGVKSIPLTPAPIKSIGLQVKDGIAISSDSAGVVRIWDISTGLPKATFKTPATGKRDVQLVNDKLIMVWYDWRIGAPGKTHVWDVEKEELLWIFGQSWSGILDIRISGNGSKVYILDHQSIQAWSISTGEAVGEVEFTGWKPCGLVVNGSRVWVSCLSALTHGFSDSDPMGWDFGTTSSSPVPLPNTLMPRPRFDFVDGAKRNRVGSSWVEDTVTGKLVFRLPERFAILSTTSQWGGHHLVIGCPSGDVLILHFNPPQPE